MPLDRHTRRSFTEDILLVQLDSAPLDTGRDAERTPQVDRQSGDREADPELTSLLGQYGQPRDQKIAPEARRAFIRTVALLCVCSLSIGSHYTSHILGPLKSRLSRELGTSNTDFSLLIAAFSLNSTWTPLVGGLLACTFGTTLMSIVATGVIFTGVSFLLLGDIWGNVRLMVLGIFVFGLGVSPLSVVQETIIVRFFKSHGLGVSMALGLIAGKITSFIAARTSYPLTEYFGSRAPFYVAASLAALSVVVNLIYITVSKWLVDEAGAGLEVMDISEEAQRHQGYSPSEAQALEKVAKERRVNLRSITKLGDVFWAYVGLNLICGGVWMPFVHLAANIIQIRYSMSEQAAALSASYLLAGSIILYPICGLVVDRCKRRLIVVRLLVVSCISTLLAFTWLAMPPKGTQGPMPAIVTYAIGHGFAPLLLVVLVPSIVAPKYVSTALGVHKSMEHTGSTLFQTFAGLSLDATAGTEHTPDPAAVQRLLNLFVILNIVQLGSVLGLAYLQRSKFRLAIPPRSRTTSVQVSNSTSDLRSLLVDSPRPDRLPGSLAGSSSQESFIPSSKEIRRGEVFTILSGALIASAWILFIGTAWFRLGETT